MEYIYEKYGIYIVFLDFFLKNSADCLNVLYDFQKAIKMTHVL